MVGTAEIVHAMTNVHQNLLERDGASTDYREVFYWAAVDVLAIVEGRSRDELWKDRGWKGVHDDEVLKPTGRLHGPYTLIATSIRRTAISALQSDPDNPRKMLLPVAKVLLDAHASALDECRERDLTEAVQQITEAIETIREYVSRADRRSRGRGGPIAEPSGQPAVRAQAPEEALPPRSTLEGLLLWPRSPRNN